MDWKIKALKDLTKGENVHSVVMAELFEQRYIKYVDSPVETELTDKGQALLVYADSPDYASKRQ